MIATIHVHLDHHNCTKVLAVRGRVEAINHVSDNLTEAKGVKYGKLTVTTSGEEFKK